MDPNASVLPPDYLLNSFGFVALGNRTSKPLTVTFDGKSWILPPYPEVIPVPPPVATWAARQHRLMGSENPFNALDVEYLVYAKDAKGKLWTGMSDAPIEQSDKSESLDRSMLPPDRQDVTELNFGRRGVDRVVLPAMEVPGKQSGTAAYFGDPNTE